MPTETLHFENARLAQQLFNHEPRNLQSLKAEPGASAAACGFLFARGAEGVKFIP
jgi:hypothetical protein